MYIVVGGFNGILLLLIILLLMGFLATLIWIDVKVITYVDKYDCRVLDIARHKYMRVKISELRSSANWRRVGHKVRALNSIQAARLRTPSHAQPSPNTDLVAKRPFPVGSHVQAQVGTDKVKFWIAVTLVTKAMFPRYPLSTQQLHKCHFMWLHG